MKGPLFTASAGVRDTLPISNRFPLRRPRRRTV